MNKNLPAIKKSSIFLFCLFIFVSISPQISKAEKIISQDATIAETYKKTKLPRCRDRGYISSKECEFPSKAGNKCRENKKYHTGCICASNKSEVKKLCREMGIPLK